MQPRPYQAYTRDRVCDHWRQGKRRVCVAIPTGGGKTFTAGLCLQGASSPLAIVHTRTLLDQTRARLPHVRVMTVQAAVRLPVGALAGHDRIFEDEAHHLASGRWATVRARYHPAALIVGATATPQRADGTPLTGLYDRLVAPVGYQELLRAGQLAPCDVVPCERYAGAPAAAYLQHGLGRPGILFAPTIEACRASVATLQAAGYRAAPIDASVPATQRRATLAAYELGELDVLASPAALSEGFDSPRAAVCVLDRECEHLGTYLQTVNRVTRPYPGKRALLLDCRGAAVRHGHPLEDREYSLDGSGIAARNGRQSSGVVRTGGGGWWAGVKRAWSWYWAA